MNTAEWNRITRTVDATRQDERVRQQALFRLFQALQSHDEGLVDRLVATGLLLDAPVRLTGAEAPPLIGALVTQDMGSDRATAAGWCAASNNVQGLQMLRAAGADLASVGPSGRDPLWHAGRNTAREAWEYLIEVATEEQWSIAWNARVNDAHRRTRLMELVLARNLEAVMAVVAGADLAAVDGEGRTALHHNLLQDPYTEDDARIGRVLSEYGAPAAAEDREGVTPAALAATPEQQAIIDRAILAEVSADAARKAQAQRDHIKSQEPLPERDPSDPGFPQIQRPVRFKRPIM